MYQDLFQYFQNKLHFAGFLQVEFMYTSFLFKHEQLWEVVFDREEGLGVQPLMKGLNHMPSKQGQI